MFSLFGQLRHFMDSTNTLFEFHILLRGLHKVLVSTLRIWPESTTGRSVENIARLPLKSKQIFISNAAIKTHISPSSCKHEINQSLKMQVEKLLFLKRKMFDLHAA